MPIASLLAHSLTCSLVFSIGTPGSAFGYAAAWQPARGSVAVDTSALGEEGPALKRRIESRAGDILLDNEVLPARDANDSSLEVEIAPAPGDEPGWKVSVYIERGGEVVGDSKREIDCTLCTEGELVDKVAEALAELVPIVVADAAEPEPVAPVEPSEGDPAPQDPVAPAKDDDQKKIGSLGFAGIGVAALGLVGVGVGVGLMAKGNETLEDDSSRLKNRKTPGGATLAIGAVALATGVALIVVDQVQQKKRRIMAAIPYLDPHGGGLAFITRF